VTALVGSSLRYEDKDAGGLIVVHVTSDGASEMLGIAVQDDGPGIPDDEPDDRAR
jgi:signal transduction histidine kinase